MIYIFPCNYISFLYTKLTSSLPLKLRGGVCLLGYYDVCFISSYRFAAKFFFILKMCITNSDGRGVWWVRHVVKLRPPHSLRQSFAAEQ